MPSLPEISIMVDSVQNAAIGNTGFQKIERYQRNCSTDPACNGNQVKAFEPLYSMCG
jgi:hypothetical protein